MRHRVLLALAAIGGLLAQPLPNGVHQGASIEGITEYTFPNGLQVLLFPDPSNPKVTVNMTVLVGSRHEGYGETGMAHLLEHLLFMRTAGGRDIKKELTGHGASWNGSTSQDRTNYFETVTASTENLRWVVSLEADRLVNSVMSKALLDTEMTVVRNEFERGENSAGRVLSERVESTAYLWHNYGKSTIGSRADIENVPIANLAAFYRKYYQPDNAVLAIAGQFNEAAALGLVAETFGKIPRPVRKLDRTYTVEPAQDGERYVALRRVGDGQIVTVAWHVPAAGHPDSAAISVMAGILSGGGGGGFRGGGGMATGRLYKALVDNKVALSAGMYARQQHDPGLAMATADLNSSQSLAEARRILVETVEGLAGEPPTKEEVERVKTRLVRAQEMRMADSQSMCLNLSEYAASGDWRLAFLNRDRIKSVTAEDVARVARKYFVESNRTVGEFIPTANPVRAEIPATPELAVVFKDYKGGAGMARGEAFDPTPANIEKRLVRMNLAGGTKLLMLPRQTRGNLVSAVLELNFGDAKSLASQRAAAQVTGGLLMRGTRNKNRQQLQDEMDRLQARIFVSGGGGGGGRGGRRGGPTTTSGISNASATIETTAENLAPALRLAIEMLREPALAENDFEQVRQQRIAALEADRTEPGSLALLGLQRNLSPFGVDDPRYVGTLEEQIAEYKKVTLEDVKKFHHDFYGASHAVLAASGRFDQAAFQKAAGDLLGGWASVAPYERLATPYRKAAAMNRKIETPDKENAQFEAGMRIQMSEDDADYAAMVLANQMFGGGLGSRMPNRIRNVEGLSYGVSSRLTAPATGDGAEFVGAAISAPQNTPKVEASFLDELAKTLQSGFTAAEVATAKQAWLNAQTVARSQEQGLVRLLASREMSGRSMKWDAELEARMKALTVDEINAAFRRHLNPAALTIVKAGDFKKAGAYQK